MNTFFPLFNTLLEENDSDYNEALIEVVIPLMSDHSTQVKPILHTLLKWNSHYIRHYCISHYSSAIHSDYVIYSLFCQYSVLAYPWRVGLFKDLQFGIPYPRYHHHHFNHKSKLDVIVDYFSFILIHKYLMTLLIDRFEKLLLRVYQSFFHYLFNPNLHINPN